MGLHFCHGKHIAHFRGIMTVIMVQLDPTDLARQFKTAMRTRKIPKRGANHFRIGPQCAGARHCRQRVINMEETRHPQGYMACRHSVQCRIKTAVPHGVVGEVHGLPVAMFPHAEGNGMT